MHNHSLRQCKCRREADVAYTYFGISLTELTTWTSQDIFKIQIVE